MLKSKRLESIEPWLLQVVFLLTLYSLLLPAIRIFIEYGHFFYINGHDEADYLSYEFSLRVQGLKKLSLYIVPYLHEHGFSGGGINFLFDFISLTVIGLIIPALIKIFYPDVSVKDRYIASFIICLTPFLLIASRAFLLNLLNNFPIYKWIYYFVDGRGTNYPIYLRTPESQFSLVLGIVFLWGFIKAGKTRWIILCTPFMYYFVGVLWFAIVFIYSLAVFIAQKKFEQQILKPVMLSALIFLIFLGAAQAVIFPLLNLGRRSALISHEPVFGFSFIVLLFLYTVFLFNRKKLNIDNEIYLFLSSIVAAVIVVYNSNVISGFVLQPQHFEFQVNILVGVFVSIFYLSITEHITKRKKSAFIVIYMFLIFSLIINTTRSDYITFKKQSEMLQSLKALPGFEEALRSEDKRVAINDIVLSSNISGFYLPKGRALATARESIFRADQNTYNDFVALKKCIKKDDLYVQERMEPILREFEKMFEHKFQNFLPLYMVRRPMVKYSYNNEPVEIDCNKFNLFIVPH
jgi:hypothetical protein